MPAAAAQAAVFAPIPGKSLQATKAARAPTTLQLPFATQPAPEWPAAAGQP